MASDIDFGGGGHQRKQKLKLTIQTLKAKILKSCPVENFNPFRCPHCPARHRTKEWGQGDFFQG
jgi:hypothetical protein